MPNVCVDRAARFHSIIAAPGLMRNTLPPLRSNELFGVVLESRSLRYRNWLGDGLHLHVEIDHFFDIWFCIEERAFEPAKAVSFSVNAIRTRRNHRRKV